MRVDERRWLTRISAATVIALLAVIAVADAMAQPGRPTATVAARPPVVDATAGATVKLILHVSLPAGVHVQANKPDDPLLIPTVVTVAPPQGVTVTAVNYPASSPLVQAGSSQTLQVLGPEFDIDIALAIEATVGAGAIDVPAQLRYQACNETTCFPAARASASWRINVRGSR